MIKIDAPSKKIHVSLSREQIDQSRLAKTANIELIETLPPAII